MHDDATPSGNGTAAKVFGRLGHLLGETRYLQAAEDTLKRLWGGLVQMPHGHASLLIALEESLFPLQCVIIRGSGSTLQDWHNLAARSYAPRRLSFAIPNEARDLPAQLQQRKPEGDTVAYICSGLTCSAPLRDRTGFTRQLSTTELQENR
jgi:uncharacterized protein YyaL (SSP411 family)